MMTHDMTDAFPEPLSRDLAFILGLDGPSASADTGGASAARSPGRVAGSATVGFSALAALLVGTTATVVAYWPAGREDDAATFPSSTAYERVKPASEAVAPAPPRLATPDAGPTATDPPAESERAPMVGPAYAARTVSAVVPGRAGAPAGLSARSPAVERARPRPPAQLVAATGSGGSGDDGRAAFATGRTNQPILEGVGVGRPAIDTRAASVLAGPAGASTPMPGLSTPPAAMNPAPIPVTNLRAARRDAQDALVGLRRQL